MGIDGAEGGRVDGRRWGERKGRGRVDGGRERGRKEGVGGWGGSELLRE